MQARRRRRGQNPKPYKENERWKFKYRIDQALADGQVRRAQKTKVLGRVDEMSFSEASREARRFVTPIDELKPGIEFSSRTVRDLIQKWRRTVGRTLRPSTQRSYEWAVKRIEPRFGNQPVSHVAKEDVEAFLIDALTEGLSYESVETVKRRLKALFSLGVDWGWISVSPVRGRFHLGTPHKVRPKTILTRDQIEALLVQLQPPYDTLIKLAVFTGLRKGELAGLRWRDVRDGFVIVSRTVVRGQEGPAKSRYSEAQVPIGPRVQQVLTSWKLLTRFPSPDDFVFAVRTPTPVQMDRVLMKVLKPAGRRIGVEPLAWHDLRHTFCTLGRREGIAPEVMQRLMRHSDIRTTLEIYSHVTDDGAVRVIEGGKVLPLSVTPGDEAPLIQ